MSHGGPERRSLENISSGDPNVIWTSGTHPTLEDVLYRDREGRRLALTGVSAAAADSSSAILLVELGFHPD